jgi:type IX secretion system PorP/SprF family membrane protein
LSFFEHNPGVYLIRFFLQLAGKSHGNFWPGLNRSKECQIEHILKTQLLQRYLQGIVFITFLHTAAYTQDIHFSQYYNCPLYLNPALTGVSKGDIRFTGAYRSQWESAIAPYETFYLSADKKYYDVAHEKWWLNSGVSVFRDRAGDAQATNTNVALSGSYTRMLNEESFLTFGISAGIGQRKFEFDKLTFDSQWNGNGFDPASPKGEDFENENVLFADFATGINWRGQRKETRSKVDIGVAGYHLNQPDQSYGITGKSKLDSRFSFYFMPTIQLNSKLDLVGSATTQIQGKYMEALAGAAGKLYFNTKKSQELALQLGFSYRFNARGDALYPSLELLFREWMVGLSWDLNVSNYSVATNRNGGPEITLRYIIHKVYPVKAFKACPLI